MANEGTSCCSERLRYEPLSTDHAQALFPVFADPAIYRYIDNHPPASVEELSKRISQMIVPPPHRADEVWWDYAVFVRESNHAIGKVEVAIVADRAEVAYILGSAFWGKGYAAEAMEWLHGQIRERTAATDFWATTLPGNSRSIRLLERLGYAPAKAWPSIGSYHPGDLVYHRAAGRAG
jgi:RimJ/RimL family protein N-acetyltransferase